ncbi:T-box transcription factor TBX6-like [Teleopsis dalmanni]|uniref:T-box transcription factor TBX6-like n=1 Tax=Teleopsis dalmanni TaxID=139649 RepID=UPI0018CD9FEF|nr:T-box transcription factor TBX6-like [Teleopsis dalmanni]
MLTMNELVDLQMQQQLAHEIYRQQIMQRIPDPFPTMLPLPIPMAAHHMIMPPRPTLPGVDAKLENNDLWKQFHKIGTEMIITKSGRRMFPSMRVSLAGLEEEANYCVLLEMVPIGDCRYKFSGSQWVPAGGAEPQSPQRMFLHPDSPATGSHWQSQAILFNKVKLTNNTLDSNGHIVLASMHKYQPRLHIIRTSDLAQIPWAPQQAFVFPETEFVAVTAYQNDRITKLKIDNNPFAKGFRETGQSRCKRKMSLAADEHEQTIENPTSPSRTIEDDRSSMCSVDSPKPKRQRANDSYDSEYYLSSGSSSGTISPRYDETAYRQNSPHMFLHHPLAHQQALIHSTAAYFGNPNPLLHPMLIEQQTHMPFPHELTHSLARLTPAQLSPCGSAQINDPMEEVRAEKISSTTANHPTTITTEPSSVSTQPAQSKRNNFSISAILAF